MTQTTQITSISTHSPTSFQSIVAHDGAAAADVSTVSLIVRQKSSAGVISMVDLASTTGREEKRRRANRDVAMTACALLSRLEAEAVRSTALMRASWWLLTLGDYLAVRRLSLALPHVTASACGEVVFEWWRDGRKLTVYVDAEGAEFVRVWGRDIDDEMAEGAIKSLPHALSLWRWLVGES